MIDASDFDKAARALSRQGFDAQAGRTASWAIRRSGNAVRRSVRAEGKRHRRTGAMRARVAVETRGRGLDTVVKVRAGGAANLIVLGTPPHEIAASRGQALTIRAPGRAGAVVGFAAVVQHPGTPADPFVHRGIERAMPEVNQIVDAAADTMARELAYRMDRRR